MQVLLCMTTYRKTICLRSVRKTLIVSSKSKQQLVRTKSDQQLYGRLDIACQSRKDNLKGFFAHKNHLYPIFIPEYGLLGEYKTKLDLLACLYAVVEPSLKPPDADIKLVYGAAFVNMNPPWHSKT